MVRQSSSSSQISSHSYYPAYDVSYSPAPLEDMSQVKSFISEKFKNGNHEVGSIQPGVNGIAEAPLSSRSGETLQNVKARLHQHLEHKSKWLS